MAALELAVAAAVPEPRAWPGFAEWVRAGPIRVSGQAPTRLAPAMRRALGRRCCWAAEVVAPAVVDWVALAVRAERAAWVLRWPVKGRELVTAESAEGMAAAAG